MNLDAEQGACLQPVERPGERPGARPSLHSLVLFAGFGLQGPRDLVETLSHVGLRGLWLGDVQQAIGAAASAHFDAVVLQVDEPMAVMARRFDHWRRAFRCPLLVVSSAADEVDEIIALEFGADGYLAGPLAPRRLRAHLLMLLRRDRVRPDDGEPLVATETRAVAGWSLDRVHDRLVRADRTVGLTALQAALLQVLIEDLDRVVPRKRLIDAVSHGRLLHARSVDVYVARLRQRLREARVDELVIDGVRGRGYRLSIGLRDGSPADSGRSAAPADLLRWMAPLDAEHRVAAPLVT